MPQDRLRDSRITTSMLSCRKRALWKRSLALGLLIALTAAGLEAPSAAASASDEDSTVGAETAQRTEQPLTVFSAGKDAAAESNADGVSGASFSLFQRKPLRIGIINLWETPETSLALHNTLLAIQKAFAPYPVEVNEWMPSRYLEHEIVTGGIDVFIASSGFSMRMQKHGVVALATLITERQPDPNNGIATTFLVRSDDSRFQKIEDLQGTRLSASYETAFMSYRTGLAEIAKRGFDPDRFFKDIHFTGDSENSAIARRLDTRQADVAMVRACWLESLPQSERRKYRVLEPQPKDVLRCEHTSRTYPNVMVSILQGSAPGAAHVIARTLLSIPEIAPGHHWGVATDLRAVDRLYRELKIENYAYLREPTYKRWAAEHAAWLAAAAILFLGLIAHSWRTTYLVRKRTAELRRTIAEREEARCQAEAMHERMARMQKATVLSQLSSLIAHELAQPIATLQYYAEGMKDLLAAPVLNRRMLEICSKGLSAGIERTKAIVGKVRGYSKSRVRRDAPASLMKAVASAKSAISPDLLAKVSFLWDQQTFADFFVRGDPLEIELLFINLLKNGCEAAAQRAADDVKRGLASPEAPFVRVTAMRLTEEGGAEGSVGFIEVTVENSGRALSDAEFATLTTPLVTSKPFGQGLGVPISISIAEASGGHLTFERRPEGGIRAKASLVDAH